MTKRFLFVVFLLGWASNSCGKSVPAKSTALERSSRFVEEIKSDLQNNRRETISEKVHFPLKVITVKKTYMLPDKSVFLAHFDEVFNENVKYIFRSQRSEDYIINWRGYGLWGGAIWLEEYSGVMKIRSIRIDMQRLVGAKPNGKITNHDLKGLKPIPTP